MDELRLPREAEGEYAVTSVHRLAATDVDGLSGTSCGGFRCDVSDQSGDFLSLQKFFYRHSRDGLRLEFLWSAALQRGAFIDARRRHSCFAPASTNCIDRDAAINNLQCERTAEAVHAVLGRAV